MGYRGIEPNNIISIERIYSIHYFEYMSDFSFEEAHDFGNSSMWIRAKSA